MSHAKPTLNLVAATPTESAFIASALLLYGDAANRQALTTPDPLRAAEMESAAHEARRLADKFTIRP